MPDELLSGLDEADSRARWERAFTQGPQSVLVADCDGDVAGFCRFGASRDDDAKESTGEVIALNVHPEAWRRGLGAELLGASLERLSLQGFSDVTLWVLEGNRRARAFYEAAGLFPDGAERTESDLVGFPLHEVRYHILLEPGT